MPSRQQGVNSVNSVKQRVGVDSVNSVKQRVGVDSVNNVKRVGVNSVEQLGHTNSSLFRELAPPQSPPQCRRIIYYIKITRRRPS